MMVQAYRAFFDALAWKPCQPSGCQGQGNPSLSCPAETVDEQCIWCESNRASEEDPGTCVLRELGNFSELPRIHHYATCEPYQLPGLNVRFLQEFHEAHQVDKSWSLVYIKDNFILPDTMKWKCAYNAVLASHPERDVTVGWLGPPSHFVSHWWGYSFSDLVDMIRSHNKVMIKEGMVNDYALKSYRSQGSFRPSAAIGPFYFIDAFAINQHDMKLGVTASEGGYHKLVENLRQSLLRCGDLLVVCEKGESGRPGWEYPAPFERIWCLFEMFQAIRSEIPIYVHLGRSARHELRQAMAKSDGMDRVRGALDRIDVETARSSVPTDREQMLHDIRSSVGVVAVNGELRTRLEGQFVRVANRCTAREAGLLHVNSVSSERTQSENLSPHNTRCSSSPFESPIGESSMSFSPTLSLFSPMVSEFQKSI